MASLFDVMDKLEQIARAAVTPNGPQTVFGRYVDVAQGWPIADDLDQVYRAGRSMVTIYAVPSTTSDPGQIMNWDSEVITPPVHGMTATATDAGFSLDGDPGLGEYATVILNGNEAYSYVACEGDYASTITGRLAEQVGPRASWADASVTFSGISRLIVRIGAPAQMGEQLHRQKQQFRIVVWAPNPKDRAAIGTALDLAFKQSLKTTLRDTSTAILTYATMNLDDGFINRGTFRADLMMSVQWDTYATYPAYEVTAVDITINNSASAHVVQ